MKENPIFDFQPAAVTSFHIKFKQLHIWGVSNTKGVKFILISTQKSDSLGST